MVTHRFVIGEGLKAYELLLAGQREPHLGLLITCPDAPAARSAPLRRVDYPAVRTSRTGALPLGVVGAGAFASGVLLPRLRSIPPAIMVFLFAVSPVVPINCAA